MSKIDTTLDRQRRSPVDRDHPVQLPNIPIQSQPPVLQEILGETAVGPGSVYAGPASHQTKPAFNVPPGGPPATAPTIHGAPADQSRLPDDSKTVFSVKEGQNKLKRVPNPASNNVPTTTHAEVSPASQPDLVSIPPASTVSLYH